MLLLAMSCLQGRPMQAAAEELLSLGVDGLQLTPGCVPTPAFAAWVQWRGVPTRRHDGFSWLRYREQVWASDGSLLSRSDSVHPPTVTSRTSPAWLERAAEAGVAVEVMYPGYELAGDASVTAAMDLGLALAVDVSHLFLDSSQQVLSEPVRDRLLSYDRVAEVHVSANDGKADRHWPLSADSWGLDWAAERATDGIPVICESYLHRTSHQDRLAMVDVLRESLTR